jgi:hypothetical protein
MHQAKKIEGWLEEHKHQSVDTKKKSTTITTEKYQNWNFER